MELSKINFMGKNEEIKLATIKAQKTLLNYNALTLKELKNIYKSVAIDVKAIIMATGENDLIEIYKLQKLLKEIYSKIDQLRSARNILLDKSIKTVVKEGLIPFALGSAAITSISNRAVKFVHDLTLADGLKLSERLWKLDQGAKERISKEVQSALIKGHSATQAAQNLIKEGKPIPFSISNDIKTSKRTQLSKSISSQIMTEKAGEYYKAERVFRTELARAHGVAYETASFETGAIGIKFMLSPNHRITDICDVHAAADLYDLGSGIYRKGTTPFPAHPNTISWTLAVYAE